MTEVASPPAAKRIKQEETSKTGNSKVWQQQETDSISSDGDGRGPNNVAAPAGAAATAVGSQQLFNIKSDNNNKEYSSSSSSSKKRVKKLRKKWLRLLEECRNHHGVPHLSEKKSEWVSKVVAVYDEYSLLTKPAASEDDDNNDGSAGGDNSTSE